MTANIHKLVFIFVGSRFIFVEALETTMFIAQPLNWAAKAKK
jgi:hypothetical protein